jgi:hypothetical protein
MSDAVLHEIERLRDGEKEILFPFAIIIDWQKKPHKPVWGLN